jgi:hypothetical protein
VEERDADEAHLVGQIGMVGDDHGAIDGQCAVALPREQVEDSPSGLRMASSSSARLADSRLT